MQPRNELERLENIIAHDISCFMELNCSVNRDLLQDFKYAMLEETERIKNNLMLTICSVKKTELRRYIQQHQQRLIKLSSHLLKYTKPEKIVSESDAIETTLLCHYIYRTLEDLLNFVERHFVGYFNPDAWVPASYRKIAVEEIGYDLKGLEQNLSTLGVDNKLISIIFLPFREFLEEEFSNEITYRKVNYLRTLKKELLKVARNTKAQGSEPAEEISRQVQHLLISLNFNSHAYFMYCTNLISLQVNATESQPHRLEKLAYCLKEINQARDRRGFIFDPISNPLKDQIANWIAEELNFQRTQQLPIDFLEGDNQVQLNTKIHLDFSVAQTACLIRAFIEGGIIQNKNLSELIRLLVSIIRSKRSETVSPESFRRRYYNIEDSVRLAVAARLRAIADYLTHKNY